MGKRARFPILIKRFELVINALFRPSITDRLIPICDQLLCEFEDTFVVIWPVYEVFEVPAACCSRQLIVYLERNRDKQGKHAVVIGSNARRIRVGDRRMRMVVSVPETLRVGERGVIKHVIEICSFIGCEQLAAV